MRHVPNEKACTSCNEGRVDLGDMEARTFASNLSDYRAISKMLRNMTFKHLNNGK